MKIELVVSKWDCSPDVFTVNGLCADLWDFGETYDASPEEAPAFGCGDRSFRSIDSTEAVLAKYQITELEYEEICDRLTDALHIGYCALCV